MNTRQNKKRKNLEQQHLQDFQMCLYGNNGGDIFFIQDIGDGKISLKSGCCCVVDIHHELPVEFLTGLIQKVYLENNGDIEKIIDSFWWSQDFKDELKSKCKKLKWYE